MHVEINLRWDLLEHKHLIRVHGVDVVVEDLGDILKHGVSYLLAILH